MLTAATTWTCTFEAVIASPTGKGAPPPTPQNSAWNRPRVWPVRDRCTSHRTTRRRPIPSCSNPSDQMQRSTGEPCRGCRRRGHGRQSINVSSPSVVVGACDAALRSRAFGAVSATHRACEQNYANGRTLDESRTAHLAWGGAKPRRVRQCLTCRRAAHIRTRST